MRRGIYVAPFDELAEPAVLVELAREAEAAGFEGFFVWDHVVYRPPTQAVADPWVALAAVAAATERLLLGPLVTPPARRRPWKLAREAVTLDRLSGGRLVLGLGLGADRSGELSGFGEETDDRARAALLDEAIEVLQVCFSGEPRGFRGEHFRLPEVAFLPRPVGPVPIWLAARWPARRPVRRAARFDGLFPIDLPEPAALAELREEVRALRGDAPFDLVVTGRPDEDPAPWEAAGATWWLLGFGQTPRADDVRAAIRAAR